jgi:hypothetical protein
MLQSASILISRVPAAARATAHRPAIDLSFVRHFVGVVVAALRMRAELESRTPKGQREVALAWHRHELKD